MNAVIKATMLGVLSILSGGAWASDPDIESLFDMNLEQLLNVSVISPSKFKQKAAEAPAIISVITRSEIDRYGANSLLEILDRSTSMAMTGSFFFPQNVASIRGDFESHSDNHMMILVNGRPIRESFTGGENFSVYNAFPINIIAQIEIIRGPGSVLYGSSAFSGVINIVTEKAQNVDHKLNAMLGSFSTRSIKASGGYLGDDLQVTAGVNYFKEDGWRFGAIDNNGQSGSFDAGENNYALVVTGNYKDITFNSMLTRSQQDFWGSTSTWSGAIDQSDRDVTSTRSMLDLGYQFDFSPENYVKTNVSYSGAHFSHYNYDSRSKNIFAEATHHWQLSQDLRWLLGITAWHQDISSEAGLSVAPVQPFNQNWWSLYGQFNYSMGDNLNWVFGAQINKIPDVSANTVPRIGFVYKLDSTSGIKLMHDQAFRAAYGVETHFDLVICCRDDGSNRGGLRGNPTLKPETVTTTDLQYYRGSEKYHFTGTLYRSSQKDLIERERAADNVLDFVNQGTLDSKGLELEYKYALNYSAQITASYTYQTNKTEKIVGTTHQSIKNFTLQPNQMFKIGYSNKFDNGVTVGLFDSWFSRAHDNDIYNANRQVVNPKADAYHLVSAKVRLPLTLFSDSFSTGAAIEIYGYNLLDEDIYQPELAGRKINTNPLRAGRSFYFSLDWAF